MVSERSVRVFHPTLFGLIAVFSLVSLAMAASLVADWNTTGYPSVYYRDRTKIVLTAGIWTCALSLYLLVGVLFASSHILFGIASHLFTLTIGFFLFLIGTASLTALVVHEDCGAVNAIYHCQTVKGLVGVSWVSTILLFIALLAVLGIGMRSRSSGGLTRGTLVSA